MICLAAACALFIYLGQGKRLSFCDEIYSYTITNSDRATYQFDAGRVYSRAEVEDMLSHTKGDTIVGTLKNVAKDKVHPPLYYIFMYISSVIQGGYSKWIGLCVNLLFLLGTVGLLWGLMYGVTGNRILAVASVGVYLFNTSTLSDMLLVRMYMAMTFFAMGLLYHEHKSSEHKFSELKNSKHKYSEHKSSEYKSPELKTSEHSGSENKPGAGIRFYPWLMLITAGGFLTQYYFAFFAMAFFVVEFVLYWKKDRARVKAYFLSMLAAVGLATVLWPLWLPSMLFNSHAGAIAESATDFVHMFRKIYEAFRIMQVSVFQRAYVFGMIFVVGLSVAFFISPAVREHRKNIRNLVMKALAGAFAYAVLVRILTPDYLTSGRYYYPAQMLEITAILLMLYSLTAEYAVKGRELVFAGLCVLFIVGDFAGYKYGYGIDYYGDAAVYDEEMAALEEYSTGLWVLTENNSYQLDAMLPFWCIPEYLVVLDDSEQGEYEALNQLDGVDRTIIVSQEYLTDEGFKDNSDRGMYYLIGSTGRFATDELLFQNGGVLVYKVEFQ